MIRLIRALGRGLIGLIFPIPVATGTVLDAHPWHRRLARLILVALITTGLWAINVSFALDRWLVAPAGGLSSYWLPLLFLLGYLDLWIGWWLLELTTVDNPSGTYPDLDEAWAQALLSIDRAGIDPRGVPLFLVLGRPAAAEGCLFNAAGTEFAVFQAPTPTAPVRAYAARDGIFVTAPKAGLLAGQATILAEPDDEPLEATPARAKAANDSASASDLILLPESEQRPPPSAADAPAREPVDRLLAISEGASDGRQRSVYQRTAEAESCRDRLRYLCRLIARDRHPYCGLNGVLLLIPAASLEGALETEATAAAIRDDLESVTAVLQVRLPVAALVCDMERVPGFTEMVRRFPAEKRPRRTGKRFGYIPEPDRGSLPEMARWGAGWVARSLVPRLTNRLFDVPVGEGGRAALNGNRELVRLVAWMRERAGRLEQIVEAVAEASPGQPLIYAGCYLAATGANPVEEQAFVADVLFQLRELQNAVAWTAEARTEDEHHRHRGWICIAAMVLMAVLAMSLLIMG